MTFTYTERLYKVFTLEDFMHAQSGKSVRRMSLHALLRYHQKKGHIINIRRGLYCIVPEGINPEDCPVDSFVVTSKMATDAALAYRTALDFFGKLHSATNEFIYLSKKNESKPFVFKGVTYKSVSIPHALKKSKQADFGIQIVRRGEEKIRVTGLERTFVDVLDRPNLCGSWEEIWRSLEKIEYLDLDTVIEYALILNSKTTVSKIGYFLETHRDEWQVAEKYLAVLQQHLPKKPIYLDHASKESNKLISQWNLIVPRSIIEKQWEEPSGNI